tara:strand:- start:3005 stop:3247 length:243 start_codon:yes stop_codon:yes gene_type:complete
MREGCEAAIIALKNDGGLSHLYQVDEATDILWTILAVRNWEQLTITCGWSQEKYIESMKVMTQQLFVNEGRETQTSLPSS